MLPKGVATVVRVVLLMVLGATVDVNPNTMILTGVAVVGGTVGVLTYKRGNKTDAKADARGDFTALSNAMGIIMAQQAEDIVACFAEKKELRGTVRRLRGVVRRLEDALRELEG